MSYRYNKVIVCIVEKASAGFTSAHVINKSLINCLIKLILCATIATILTSAVVEPRKVLRKRLWSSHDALRGFWVTTTGLSWWRTPCSLVTVEKSFWSELCSSFRWWYRIKGFLGHIFIKKIFYCHFLMCYFHFMQILFYLRELTLCCYVIDEVLKLKLLCYLIIRCWVT